MILSPIIGLRPAFRVTSHRAPVNDNIDWIAIYNLNPPVPMGVRAEWIVAACEFVRRRSAKLARRGLRMVRT